MNTRTIIKVVAGFDAQGDPEEFTWDLFPLIPPAATKHLDSNGLPKIGAKIVRGMILVGLIGKSETYDAGKRPNTIEIQGLGRAYVNAKYGHMWLNKSAYAGDEACGTVLSARIELQDGISVAVVEIEKSPIPTPDQPPSTPRG